MAETTKEKVIRAIKGGFICVISYKGKPGNRYIEPVVLGVTTAGNASFRAFQRRGFSETDRRGWKLFLIEDIAKIRVTRRKFGPRELYNPSDRGLRQREAVFAFEVSLNARMNRLVDTVLEAIQK